MRESSFASACRRRSSNRGGRVPPHAKGTVSRPYRAFDPEWTVTQGGASLCPGLMNSQPFRLTIGTGRSAGVFKQSHHSGREASLPLPPPSRSFVSLAVTDPDFRRTRRARCLAPTGLSILRRTVTQGGASLCPGLMNSQPFRLTIGAGRSAGVFKQSNHRSREAFPPLPLPSRSFGSLAVTDPDLHRKARTPRRGGEQIP